MRRDPVLVDLALQGGGAHGAFTWGVLDRLLEEPCLRIDGISGTSAGAMNAAVLIDGHAAGGAEGARAALEAFWRSVSRAAEVSPLRRTPLDLLLGRWTLDYSPAFVAMDLASRLFSPYDLNPGGFNPLRGILAESIDVERLAQAPIKLFVTATNVRTGRGRVFRNAEISPDVLLASACLPTLFQAIEIDGEAYWDGGYSGNPTITPLVRKVDDDCLRELRWLYDRRDFTEARRDLAAWLAKWQATYPKLCGWVEEHIEETLTFYRLPRQHHKHLKSTNLLERLNEEIKRRTHVVRIFPNAASCLRLIRALAVETHENWLEAHRYLNMDDLREPKKEALRMAA